MALKLIEPLRELFKDEVRELGAALELPRHVLWRQPFPGPGLAVRVLGEVTRPRCDVLRAADVIIEEEIRAAGLYESIWQSFGVLLPVQPSASWVTSAPTPTCSRCAPCTRATE